MVPGERFNAITHLVGSVLAIIATAVAVTLTATKADARTITAVANTNSISLSGAALAASASCTFSAKFAPTAAGRSAADLMGGRKNCCRPFESRGTDLFCPVSREDWRT